MLVKFICYEKESGRVFLMLPELPDNSDYLTTNKIVYDGVVRARGIHWENVAYKTFDNPREVHSREFETIYDEENDTFSVDPNWPVLEP